MKKTKLRYELFTESGVHIFKRIKDVNKFICKNKKIINFCWLYKMSEHRYKIMYKILKLYSIEVGD